MTRTLIHMIESSDAGMRLDVLAAERNLYASRSAAARAIDEGRVFVNGNVVAKKYVVASGDAIAYEVDEDVPQTHLVGQPIDLDIRFEDDELLVLSKQVGLVCHPSVDHFEGTLVNALIYHCGVDHLCNVQGEQDRLG
ncbi:MAG: S4 domain-containing protein, partial [Raoultibacter sp.]